MIDILIIAAIVAACISVVLGVLHMYCLYRWRKRWKLTDFQSIRRDLLKVSREQAWKDEVE